MAKKIIECDECRARFDVARYPAGSRVRCGKCGNILDVPEDDDPEAARRRAAAAFARKRAPSGKRSSGRGQSSRKQAPSRDQASRSHVRPAADVQPPSRSKIASDGPAVTSAVHARSTPRRDPLLDATVNDTYQIVRKLGEGGYGAVYEATDITLRRRVAVKVMLPSRAKNREYVAKFLREARTAAQLSHPNVVAVHGVGFDANHKVHFLAMEFVEGRTLHDVLQERGPLPPEEAIEYIVQSCRGLAAAHERNIIHRDIKPGNLMITPAGTIKIADFGLAKVYDPNADQSTVIGTPYFMPPEQFEGKAKDGRTDIYALGVTFYYMLTMERPHGGSGPAQILLSIMTKDPKSILAYRPELPEGLWPIVNRMIHRDLGTRYGDCRDIIRDLENLLGTTDDEDDDLERIYCPDCGASNDMEAAACTSCSASLLEECPVCGAQDMAGTVYCGECGANIPQERATLALCDEAREFLERGELQRARGKLSQAADRSPENITLAQLLGELSDRTVRLQVLIDGIRDSLHGDRAGEASERLRAAREEFAEAPELKDLQREIDDQLDGDDLAEAGQGEALARARRMEAEQRYREALVAWRAIRVLDPGNAEAEEAERRTAENVERAEALFAEGVARLDAGDPAEAVRKLRAANDVLPSDPLISGRLEEAERQAGELESELAELQGELEAGSNSPVVLARLKALADRFPGSEDLRNTLEEAESAGRQASEKQVERRLAKLLADAAGHEERKELRRALNNYRAAAALDTDDAAVSDGLTRVRRRLAEFDAMVEQSRSLLQVGDPEGAIGVAEKALDILPGDPSAQAQLARGRTTLETLQLEADRVRTAIAGDPDDEVLNWARELAGRYSGSSLAADVLREAQEACREKEDEAQKERADKELERARKLEAEHNLVAALGSYRDVLELIPDHADAKDAAERLEDVISRGRELAGEAAAALQAGDPDEAVRVAEESLELVPAQPEAASTLAAARTALTEIERAVRSYTAGLDPDKARLQLERMERLVEKYPGSERCVELHAKALAEVQDAGARAGEAEVQGYVDAARIALESGRLDDAVEAAGQALELRPDQEEAQRTRDEAQRRLDRSAELCDAAAEATREERHDDALAQFSEALELAPGNGVAAEGVKAARSAIAERKSRLRTAVQAARKLGAREGLLAERAAWEAVLALDPEHAGAREQVGRIDKRIVGLRERAAKAYARVAAGDPEEALPALEEARTSLGADEEIESRLEEARAAKQALDEALATLRERLASEEEDLDEVVTEAEALQAQFAESKAASALLERARKLAIGRKRERAITEVRKLVLEGRYATAVEHIAELREQGVESPDLAKAEAECKQAVEEVAGLRAEAQEARESGDLETAKERHEQILQRLPQDADARAAVQELDEIVREVAARRDMADTASRRGELARAEELITEACELNPGSEELRQEAAAMAAARTRRSELLDQAATALASGDGAACTEHATAACEAHPDDDEAEQLRTAGQSLVGLCGALAGRARLQLERDETDAARSTVELLARIAPEHADTAELRARLGG